MLGWARAAEEKQDFFFWKEGVEESCVDPWSGVTDSPASW